MNEFIGNFLIECTSHINYKGSKGIKENVIIY